MEQNTITITIEKLVEILRNRLGQIDVEACKQEKWVSGKKYSLDISLAELDSQYEGAISECLDALSNNDGVITDVRLVHGLNPCLAKINAIDNEEYAKCLRDIEQYGVAVSRPLYDWQMGFPFFFYKDTQTLRLTIIGIPKKM